MPTLDLNIAIALMVISIAIALSIVVLIVMVLFLPEKVVPCPICGCRPKHYKETDDYTLKTKHVYQCDCGMYGFQEPTKNAAAMSWNTRAELYTMAQSVNKEKLIAISAAKK